MGTMSLMTSSRLSSSWVVNLNPLLPLVAIFYQGEGNGGVEAQRSKVEVRGLCYRLGVDVEPKNLSVKFTLISESW